MNQSKSLHLVGFQHCFFHALHDFSISSCPGSWWNKFQHSGNLAYVCNEWTITGSGECQSHKEDWSSWDLEINFTILRNLTKLLLSSSHLKLLFKANLWGFIYHCLLGLIWTVSWWQGETLQVEGRKCSKRLAQGARTSSLDSHSISHISLQNHLNGDRKASNIPSIKG